MPTYSSFIFSDKEKNDIKKLHESYRMSYGRLIKEQDDAETDKLNLAESVEGDGSLDSRTNRKALSLKDLYIDLRKIHGRYTVDEVPVNPHETSAVDAKILLYKGTINIYLNEKWYRGDIDDAL